MVYTSSYDCVSEINNTYSISGNRGVSAGYYGDCYPSLAPKKEFWNVFHNNIGVIPFEDNVKFYVTEYWKHVLSKLDPSEVYKELDGSVLLCYERSDEFCHRHIVAAWFELLLNIHVPEVVVDNYKLKEVSRPDYIFKYLDEAMRTDRDMKGFNSLMALYYYEKSEKLEEIIESFKCKDACCPAYMSEIISLRCYADMIEDNYNNQKKLVK